MANDTNDVTAQVLSGGNPSTQQPANIAQSDPATASKATDVTQAQSVGNQSDAVSAKTDADASGDIPLVTAMATDEKELQDHDAAIKSLTAQVVQLTTVTNAQTEKLNALSATASAPNVGADGDRVHRLMRRVFGED